MLESSYRLVPTNSIELQKFFQIHSKHRDKTSFADFLFFFRQKRKIGKRGAVKDAGKSAGNGTSAFSRHLYVLDGELIGEIAEKRDYDTRNGKMQITFENSFFAENFGRNDFKELNQAELKNGYALRYLTKYISKTNERITYSRGVPTEIYKQVDSADIATYFLDYVTKYVFFDDVIDWERDIARKKYRQVNIIDLFCNPYR